LPTPTDRIFFVTEGTIARLLGTPMQANVEVATDTVAEAEPV
jgi:hypothetical protein